MIVHQTYAQIHADEVKNIIICDNYELANYLARATYGQDAFAVECTQYTCGIGNSYRNGTFYRILDDGTSKPIPYIPTPEQQVNQLTYQMNQQDELSIDLDYRLSCMELGL